MSVNQIYELETCKIMHQVVLEVASQPLLDLFENQIRPLTTQTRSSSHFIPCKTNRIKCRQSIRHCGPIVWNSLPIVALNGNQFQKTIFLRMSHWFLQSFFRTPKTILLMSRHLYKLLKTTFSFHIIVIFSYSLSFFCIVIAIIVFWFSYHSIIY